jgi:hypothetical protein
MPAKHLSPEKQTDIERLTREIHEIVHVEIGEPVANLVTSEDAHHFGHNEFRISALAHRIAAKAVVRPVARKKPWLMRRNR